MKLLSYEAEADAALEAFLAEVGTRRARGGEIILPGESAPIIYSPSPFQSRVRRLELPLGGTLADAVALTGVGPTLQKHIGVYVGDTRVPRAMWGKVRPRAGAEIFIRAELSGGGGKNPLRAILTLALVVVAVWAGPAIAGAFGLVQGTLAYTAVSTLATAAVLTAGQYLVNALIPPPKITDQFGFDQQPGNPYAQITGLSNRAVPYGPIPRVIGKRRMYPMLAAHPYTESQGSDQYLRMLLLVGYGPLDISDIRIGTTPITDFPGAQYEIREGWPSDSSVTLYTKSIHEEPLSVLLDPSVANTRDTQVGTTEVSIDITLPKGLAHYDSSSGAKSIRSVAFTVQWSADGGANYTNAAWIGGSSQFGTDVNGQITATDASQQTVVRSGRFSVPSPGIYKIKVVRTTAAGGQYDVDTAYWTALRSIKPQSPINMGGLALIALRLKATAQLNGAPDTINCLAHSYLPIYNPATEAWTYTKSRNPAWGFADILRRRGQTSMIADSRIKVADIVSWANACDATAPNAAEPTAQCDMVLEGGSVITAANAIAAHGRAQLAVVDGKYTVVRDAPQSTPVQHISPRNSRNYRGYKAFVDLPHALRVTFLNPDKDDAQDVIIVYRDEYNADGSGGKTAATKFETLDLPGCKSATMAWREGRYHLAQVLLRPEEHSVDMDIEALRCVKGDLVRFSHDVVSIGLGDGRLADVATDGNGMITAFHVDAPVDMAEGYSYAVRVRNAQGVSSVHMIAPQIGTQIELLRLNSPVSVSGGPAAGDLFQFGLATLETAPMLIKRIQRGLDFTATVTLVDAQDGVWTADQGAIPAFSSYITDGLPIAQLKPDAPTITLRSDETAIQRLSDGTLIDRLEVAIAPPAPSNAPAKHWEVELRDSSGNGDYRNVARNVPIDTLTVFVQPVVQGDIVDVRARTVSIFGQPSDWTEVTGHTIVGKTTPPDPISDLIAVATVDGVSLSYTPPSAIDVVGVEFRYGGSDWGSASLLGPLATSSPVVYALELSGSVTIRAKAIDAIGLYSSEVTVASPAANAATQTETRYIRQTLQPATPTGDNPAGWTTSVPAGNGALWISTAAKSATGALVGAWSTPTQAPFINDRGAYDASQIYYPGDLVAFNGGSYRCVTSTFEDFRFDTTLIKFDSTTHRFDEAKGSAPSGTAQDNAYWAVYAAPPVQGGSTPSSDFVATVNLTSTTGTVNLRTLADAAGFTGASNANVLFVVPNGVTIQGLANGGVAIDSGAWPAGYTITLALVVQSGGAVLGGGGNGGAGAAAGNGASGSNGGDAVYCRATMSVTVDSGGAIKSGGGGGGGGGYRKFFDTGDRTWLFMGGGGGGGGFPNGVGGAGAAGAPDGGSGDGAAGGAGTTSGPGTGGAPGTDGTHAAGAGGNGGDAGVDGSAGGGTATSTAGAGGAQGAAGYAVRKNGNAVSVTNNGTMLGLAA